MGATKTPKKRPAVAKTKVKTRAEAEAVANAALAEAPTDERRYEMIAYAAYLRAEQRGFAPGGELDDWLAATADVDARRAAE